MPFSFGVEFGNRSPPLDVVDLVDIPGHSICAVQSVDKPRIYLLSYDGNDTNGDDEDKNKNNKRMSCVVPDISRDDMLSCAVMTALMDRDVFLKSEKQKLIAARVEKIKRGDLTETTSSSCPTSSEEEEGGKDEEDFGKAYNFTFSSDGNKELPNGFGGAVSAFGALSPGARIVESARALDAISDALEAMLQHKESKGEHALMMAMENELVIDDVRNTLQSSSTYGGGRDDDEEPLDKEAFAKAAYESAVERSSFMNVESITRIHGSSWVVASVIYSFAYPAKRGEGLGAISAGRFTVHLLLREDRIFEAAGRGDDDSKISMPPIILFIGRSNVMALGEFLAVFRPTKINGFPWASPEEKAKTPGPSDFVPFSNFIDLWRAEDVVTWAEAMLSEWDNNNNISTKNMLMCPVPRLRLANSGRMNGVALGGNLGDFGTDLIPAPDALEAIGGKIIIPSGSSNMAGMVLLRRVDDGAIEARNVVAPQVKFLRPSFTNGARRIASLGNDTHIAATENAVGFILFESRIANDEDGSVGVVNRDVQDLESVQAAANDYSDKGFPCAIVEYVPKIDKMLSFVTEARVVGEINDDSPLGTRAGIVAGLVEGRSFYAVRSTGDVVELFPLSPSTINGDNNSDNNNLGAVFNSIATSSLRGVEFSNDGDKTSTALCFGVKKSEDVEESAVPITSSMSISWAPPDPPASIREDMKYAAYEPACLAAGNQALVEAAFEVGTPGSEFKFPQSRARAVYRRSMHSNADHFWVIAGLGNVPDELRSPDYKALESVGDFADYVGAPLWYSQKDDGKVVTDATFGDVTNARRSSNAIESLNERNCSSGNVSINIFSEDDNDSRRRFGFRSSYIFFGVVDLRPDATVDTVRSPRTAAGHTRISSLNRFVPAEADREEMASRPFFRVSSGIILASDPSYSSVDDGIAFENCAKGKWYFRTSGDDCIKQLIAVHESVADDSAYGQRCKFPWSEIEEKRKAYYEEQSSGVRPKRAHETPKLQKILANSDDDGNSAEIDRETFWMEGGINPLSDGWYQHVHGVGVDGGMAGFFDFEHYRDTSSLPPMPDRFVFAQDEGGSSYEFNDRWNGLLSNTVGNSEGATPLPHGCASYSGYGDGCYSLHLQKRKDGSIVAARIVFVFDEDGDE